MSLEEKRIGMGFGFGRDTGDVPPPMPTPSSASTESLASNSDLINQRSRQRNVRFTAHGNDSFVCEVDSRSGNVGSVLAPRRGVAVPSTYTDALPTFTVCQDLLLPIVKVYHHPLVPVHLPHLGREFLVLASGIPVSHSWRPQLLWIPGIVWLAGVRDARVWGVNLVSQVPRRLVSLSANFRVDSFTGLFG
jgi:hypothetical protein